jgi:hypothetical protein
MEMGTSEDHLFDLLCKHANPDWEAADCWLPAAQVHIRSTYLSRYLGTRITPYILRTRLTVSHVSGPTIKL